ncbi:MAG: STAS/SEC14 domain-containing protein [Pirellulaceae bacterium]|nr:STAS/SEC14 domain-containing protein [Pirellulaceae bacterium]
MTIEITEHQENKQLDVVVSGKLSAQDYAHFEPAVANMISEDGKIKILFTMHEFHGWEVGAVWEDIKFATKHCSDISKIAMVGEHTWEKWMAAICKPFTMSSIKYFDTGQEEEARAWLAAD